MKISRPKTLAERLEWMAKNLPGFSDELDRVAKIQRHSLAKASVGALHHSQPHLTGDVDVSGICSTHNTPNSK